MRALGFDVKKADVLKVLRDYDKDNNGKIFFDDFNEVSKYHSDVGHFIGCGQTYPIGGRGQAGSGRALCPLFSNWDPNDPPLPI